MSAQGYEILSLAARYWFIALGMLIVILSGLTVYRSVRRDLSHAGEEAPILTLLLKSDADRKLKRGYSAHVYNEGMVGRGHNCDTVIRHKGLLKKHASFREEGGGIRVSPVRGAPVALNGEPAASDALAYIGDTVQLGQLVFILARGGASDETA